MWLIFGSSAGWSACWAGVANTSGVLTILVNGISVASVVSRQLPAASVVIFGFAVSFYVLPYGLIWFVGALLLLLVRIFLIAPK